MVDLLGYRAALLATTPSVYLTTDLLAATPSVSLAKGQRCLLLLQVQHLKQMELKQAKLPCSEVNIQSSSSRRQGSFAHYEVIVFALPVTSSNSWYDTTKLEI